MLIGGGAPHVRWKRGIDRLVPPCREVGLQMGIDRARVGQHERRDVVGFIIVQHSGRVARANRHVLPEEAGRRQQPVHAGTVVKLSGRHRGGGRCSPGVYYRWLDRLSRIDDAKLIRSMSRKECTPKSAVCEVQVLVRGQF